MESEAVLRGDPTWRHERYESDSGYSSLGEAQQVECRDTGYAIEGRGKNRGPNSDAGRYAYPPREYEMVYIKEGARQLEQVDPRTRTTESELFRSEDIMARPYSGNSREDEDRERCRRSTPNTNITENLLEQQMNLMRELIQMVNIQNARMRDQMNIRNELCVMPEKYAGTSSFHSFMA